MRAWNIGRLMLVAGTLLCPLSVAGAPQRVAAAFVGLRTLGVEAEEADKLEQAVAKRLSEDPHYRSVSHGDTSLTERCKADLRCYCRATRGKQLPRVLYGNVGRIEDNYTIELILVDTHNCSIDNSVFITEQLGATGAGNRLGELTEKLLKPRESISNTAAKAERDVDTVPAVVTVVSDKQMQQLGITRLDELFRLVPGFELVDTNWGDVPLHHGLSKTLLYMIDGVPLSNPKINFSVLGQDFAMALNDVERIEFVRGPGSVLWGQNAFLGIVNFITREPSGERERARVHLRLGTLNTQEFHASVGGNRRWLSYYLGTTFIRSEGPSTRVVAPLVAGDLVLPAPVWAPGSASTDNEADTYVDVTAKARLAQRFELLFRYMSAMTYFEISPFGAPLPPEERGFWDLVDLLYAASWEDELPRGLRYRLSASRYEHRSWENFAVYPSSPSLPFGVVSLQGNEHEPEVNHLVEGRLEHRLERSRFSNRALVGISYLHQQMPDQYATFTTGQAEGQEALDIEDHAVQTFSAYLQDDLALLSGRLLVSGGLRYDAHDPFKSALSSQGALIGGTERLRLKAVFSEGFRTPTMNDLYSTTGVKGNENLRPERSRALSFELTGRPLLPLTLRVGGSYAWLTDLIRKENIDDQTLRDQGFVNRPVNRGEIQIITGFAEARVDWPKLAAFATYTYKRLDEEQVPDQACQPLFARQGHCIPAAGHTASAGVSLRPLNDFNAFATASLVGPRTAMAWVPNTAAPSAVELGTYVLVDAGLTVSNLMRMFDFTIKARNPLRASYRSPSLLDGRPSPLLERRRVTEVLFTLGWSGALPWPTGAES